MPAPCGPFRAGRRLLCPSVPDDELGRLEALADAKELQLARTHSVRAIENLQAMYGYYIDKGQWQKAAAPLQPPWHL